MTVFDEIREGAAWVAARARSVRVDGERLMAYASALPIEEIRNPVLDRDAHVLGGGVDTVAFFLILDAVNFGSGWFPVLRKRTGCSGYFTVAHALRDEFMKNGPPPAALLAGITPERCAGLFSQDATAREPMELMTLFARALNDLGALVQRTASGSYAAFVDSAGGCAGNLVRALAAMPLYRDVATYDDRTLPFYKRAQLTCADLWLACGGAGLGRFDDIDELTIFADNLVPHVLRHDSVLVYEPKLAHEIDTGRLIDAGSDEEIEIRACAVFAVERIAAELGRLGRPASPRRLDYWLWNRGGRPEFKAHPRHRARTAFY